MKIIVTSFILQNVLVSTLTASSTGVTINIIIKKYQK